MENMIMCVLIYCFCGLATFITYSDIIDEVVEISGDAEVKKIKEEKPDIWFIAKFIILFVCFPAVWIKSLRK